MVDYDIVSADSHIIEPPDLWEKWLTPEFRKRAPQLTKDEEGGDAWDFHDGGKPMTIGLVTKTRGQELRGAALGRLALRHDQPGLLRGDGAGEGDAGGRRAARSDLPAAAHHAPLHARRGQGLPPRRRAGIQRLAGQGLRAARRRITSSDRGRFPTSASTPSIAEMRRCRDMGLRGVVISSWPSGKPFLDDDCDPFWAEAEKLDIPGQRAHQPGAQGPAARADRQHRAQGRGGAHRLQRRGVDHHAADRRRDDLLGPVRQVPDLKMVGVECGAGWVPYFLEQMDDRYWRNRGWAKSTLSASAERVLQAPLDDDVHHRSLRRRQSPRGRRATT